MGLFAKALGFAAGRIADRFVAGNQIGKVAEAIRQSGRVDGAPPPQPIRFQFVTEADEFVCPRCQNVDGIILTIGTDGRFRDAGGQPSDMIPPIHPRCRCRLVKL